MLIQLPFEFRFAPGSGNLLYGVIRRWGWVTKGKFGGLRRECLGDFGIKRGWSKI